MTNEELATAYQAAAPKDKPTLLCELWEQNVGLLTRMAYSYFTIHSASCLRAGQMLEDLKQIAFFALCAAAEAYKPESEYKFTSYLNLQAKSAFNKAVGRWKRDKNGDWKQMVDTLNTCTSLDKPVLSAKDGSEVDTLGGTIQDARQADLLEQAEETEYTRQLHDALEKGISELTEDQQHVLRLRYFGNLSQQETGLLMGYCAQNISSIEAKAIRRMRYPQRLKYIKAYHDDIIDRFAWYGLGFGSWQSSGASGVEKAVERAEEKTEEKFEYWFMD